MRLIPVHPGSSLRGDAGFWKTMCNGRAFSGEKFLTAASVEDHHCLTDLAVLLYEHHYDHVRTAPKYAIAWMMISPPHHYITDSTIFSEVVAMNSP